MSLQNQLREDLDDIFTDASGAAEDASYLVEGSQQGRPCKVMLDRTLLGQQTAEDGQNQTAEAMLSVRVAEIPVVHINDRFVVGALGTPDKETFAVTRIMGQNAGLHELSVILIERGKLIGTNDEQTRK